MPSPIEADAMRVYTPAMAGSTTCMAIDCRWLRRTIESGQSQNPFRTLCTHIVRDGSDCVGPFLEDMETDCRLWEPNERLAARLPSSVRDGWQWQ
jgi:hypothetical protein